MKVLWFEVTMPARYKGEGLVIGGWQDSLERVIRSCGGVELTVAFEASPGSVRKHIDGVRYIPICLSYSQQERKRMRTSWEPNAEKLLPAMKKIVDEVQPDIIQVFGTEWPFGLIAEFTDVPVVIHIQGAIVPYNNAMYPPRYSLVDVFRAIGLRHPRRLLNAWRTYRYDCSRELVERRIWRAVSNYMGRTGWDEALSEVMHPGRRYFHVEESLRESFVAGEYQWKGLDNSRIQLFSTGCSTFWKGPDMLLKTASVLKSLGVDFVWYVAGHMPDLVRATVESKEGLRFRDFNVEFLGYIGPEELSRNLSAASIYVHTAYAENSPNSICEAQCVGVPVVATNVGGISSLVQHGDDGYLVPANDPWQMAHAIVSLSQDKEKMKRYSICGKERAMRRHDDGNIKIQIMDCYNEILKMK